MREVLVLRFRKINDANVTTKHSTKDLIDKKQVFTNILVNRFEVGERFISYDIENPKNNLTLGSISAINVEMNKFAVTSEVDGSVTYFKCRMAEGVLHTSETSGLKKEKGRSSVVKIEESNFPLARLEIIEKPSDWDDAL